MSHHPLTNWAGNVRYRAGTLHRPSSVDELRALVAGADRIRALGSAHSFSTVADTTGDLVSLAGLPATIAIEPDRRAVTVPAGVRYGELAVELHRHGYALANLGSLPHIAVGGACATGTHGSGDRLSCLAGAVSGLELVTADGTLTSLDRVRDGDRFAGCVVALGALGVVTRLTLDVEPTFDVAQSVWTDLPWAALADHLDAVFTAGYSVSLFTTWGGPVVDQVWVKRRTDEADRHSDLLRALGARAADAPQHPAPGMPPGNCTQQLDVPGPWHERLPHFRLGFTPSSGDELQTEYLLPRDAGPAALAALAEVRDRIAPVLQVTEVRTVAADELWLSPAYRRDSLAVHFTWRPDPVSVRPVVELVEQQLAPFAPRPHWGKVFGLPPGTVAAGYPRLPDFAALVRAADPAGKFGNDFVDRYVAGATG